MHGYLITLEACGWYALLAFTLWVFFLAAMSLKTVNDHHALPPVARLLAYGVMAIGYPLDFTFNVASSVLFLELPHEWVFTARVSRHIHDGSGWRKVLALWFCRNLLDPFAVGGHCQ